MVAQTVTGGEDRSGLNVVRSRSFIVGGRGEVAGTVGRVEAQMRRGKDFQNKSQRLAGAIIGDIHFWVPVVVLVAGLAVLRWIS